MGLVAFFSSWGRAGAGAMVLSAGKVVVLVHILPCFSTNQEKINSIKTEVP